MYVCMHVNCSNKSTSNLSHSMSLVKPNMVICVCMYVRVHVCTYTRAMIEPNIRALHFYGSSFVAQINLSHAYERTHTKISIHTLSLSLSLSLSPTHTHATHVHTHTHAHMHTLHTHELSPPPPTLPPTHSCDTALERVEDRSTTHIQTHTHSNTHIQTHTHSNTHTFKRTHIQTHTQL